MEKPRRFLSAISRGLRCAWRQLIAFLENRRTAPRIVTILALLLVAVIVSGLIAAFAQFKGSMDRRYGGAYHRGRVEWAEGKLKAVPDSTDATLTVVETCEKLALYLEGSGKGDARPPRERASQLLNGLKARGIPLSSESEALLQELQGKLEAK